MIVTKQNDKLLITCCRWCWAKFKTINKSKRKKEIPDSGGDDVVAKWEERVPRSRWATRIQFPEIHFLDHLQIIVRCRGGQRMIGSILLHAGCWSKYSGCVFLLLRGERVSEWVSSEPCVVSDWFMESEQDGPVMCSLAFRFKEVQVRAVAIVFLFSAFWLSGWEEERKELFTQYWVAYLSAD